MKKLYYLVFIFLLFCRTAKADHITGGEISYTYSQGSDGMINYRVTFKLFMRCNSNRQFNNPTIVSVFDKATNERIQNINVNLTTRETIQITESDPCITNQPNVCYEVGYYQFAMSLPPSKNGYILSSQVNYRIAGINNLQPGYNNVGALYSAEVPGTAQVTNGPSNNSAKFVGNDLVVVCANNRFSYSFAAEDSDGDQLRYSFCNAYQSGGAGNTVIPPPAPPYRSVPYGNGFLGSTPLGGNVQINASTGLITGVAPDAGIYVVTVCVEEIRAGVVIATQRKDLQINIAPCNIAAAMLQPDYMLCDQTKTISLANLSTSPLIQTYYWQLTNRNGSQVYTTTEPTVNYTFSDTGTYNIKLVINRNQGCTDSTTSIARVYPGFVPNFDFTGICYTRPTNFTDKTTTVYGTVDTWSWDFGTGADFSDKKNPVITYGSMGTRNVQLIVTNSVGCRDTATKPISIVDAPPITFAFRDTLICLGDKITLQASGSGAFTWSPQANMVNANSGSPTVSPTVTTTYIANINDNGCVNNDSLKVRVTDHVTLQVMKDTTICRGDTIQLRIQSDAFKYLWSPANQIIDPAVANPLAVTTNNTTYHVTANIGGCSATGSVAVSTIPYPTAFAGNDTLICFNSTVRLSGVSNGTTIRWAPAPFLDNSNSLNPVAKPPATTNFILYAFDTRGCPKPATDSVLVTVLPAIAPHVGNDTSVLVEQSLQLNAAGGTSYQWSPPIGLSSTNIADPTAMYSEAHDNIRYKILVSNEAGCTDSTFINIKVFNTGPSIFVPTAFTPNADGKNDLLRPIAVGIKQIDYFKIYNRWAQLVFVTQINGKGWDGTINGVAQPTGVFVWMVKATDFNGTPYFRKGTVTLIR